MLFLPSVVLCVPQTYTYDIKPIKDSSRPEQKLVLLGSTASSEGPGATATASSTTSNDNIHSYEVSPPAGRQPPSPPHQQL